MVKKNHFDYDLLLGLDAIKKFKLSLAEDLRLHQNIGNQAKELVENVSSEEHGKQIWMINTVATTENSLTEVNHKQQAMHQLISKHERIFTEDKFAVDQVKKHRTQVRLVENRYVYKKPYRCTAPDQKEISHQINKLLDRVHLLERQSL